MADELDRASRCISSKTESHGWRVSEWWGDARSKVTRMRKLAVIEQKGNEKRLMKQASQGS